MVLAIAGERSGVGKTTVTLALLSYLASKEEAVQSFKVGPDYIDPMFHAEVTGRPCRNLDPILTSEEYVRHCFRYHCQNVDFALVEGVMGLFDGVRAIPERPDLSASNLPNDLASTAQIARLLDIPILLVIDCSRLSGSVAAIAQGYRNLDPTLKIAGLVLNRVGSDRHQKLIQEALEPLQIPIFGILPRQADISLRDRHLGLIPTDELTNFQTIRDRLATLGRDCFDWEKLIPLLKVPYQLAPSEQFPHLGEGLLTREKIRIGIARDRAFNFYYPDNLDLLQHLGAELIPWSPLHDSKLPQHLQGLYLGGGFPEIFAPELSVNKSTKKDICQAIQTGMPTYAECGGLMYLSQQIVDLEGQTWSMVGSIPTTATMSRSLTLGYRQATALLPNLIIPPGETLWGHEFHHSQLSTAPKKPLYALQSLNDTCYPEGWYLQQLQASYLHLHWGAQPQNAQRFLQSCLNTKKQSPPQF
ncbi:cobyrinate a,c-diamide synthase [Oscillatoria sp. FACHB-1406]|uniref:cobyrinate a,c-diamide synthase n=1 Tax=Oscillatoria sp. FACHB-1406 TaxID=2692846 RepID=UPI0016858AFB|nr:cobyrinate a,c-diamide synthase [Oscillatoria sp. FACHB-1406]MBD2578969.1 cobyrinate a,c-diamide synthase [Oscillatoria sp. FACHB-1406]